MHLHFDIQHRFKDGFSLDVCCEYTGESLGLTGPSGSGKTSLISILAGIRRAQSQRIIFDKVTLASTDPKTHMPAEKRKTALCPQDPVLFSHMNVQKNLEFGLKYVENQLIESRETAELLQIQDILQQNVMHISGGQARRVALGRALLSHPRFLILDEPFTGLDISLKTDLRRVFKSVLQKFSIPFLLISHDPEDFENLCDHIIHLNQGRVSHISKLS
jgi:molybdate transport system ATP-binding protein